MPSDWSKEQKQWEQDKRKKWNADYMRRVKEAKANYENTEKQVPKEIERAKVLYEIYRNAKDQ